MYFITKNVEKNFAKTAFASLACFCLNLFWFRSWRIKFSGWVLALVVVYVCAPPLVAAPRLSVESSSWNFGRVTNTTQLMHDFVLRNTGDAKLDLKRVVTSCGSCLKVYLNGTSIAPGGSLTAHGVLDTRLLGGDIFRTITVESNDPQTAVKTLELFGTIVPAYELSPVELTIGGAVEQQKSSVDIVPLMKLYEPLSVVECDNTNIVADVFEDPPGQYHVVARAAESLPRGNSVFNVVVRSLNSNDLPCKIVGQIDFPQDYEVIPSQLMFEAKDEPQMRIVWLRQHGDVVLSLMDAVPSSGEFHCEIEPDPASADYRIYVEARNLAAVKGQARRIDLKGMTQEQQTVVLAVGMVIR